MAPHFTFFSQSINNSGFLKTLADKFCEPFVDGLSSTIPMIKDRYRNVNGRFYSFENTTVIESKLDEFTDDEKIPNLLMSFDKDVQVSEDDWTIVVGPFIKSLVDDTVVVDQEKFYALAPKPIVVYSEKEEEEKKVDNLMVDYTFEYVVDKEVDIAFCQICKPFTDSPYTVVIRNYSQKGLLPFFTSIFVSTSWGVASHDIVFLNKLWTFLEMEKTHGAFDLENRLKEHVRKCTEHLEIEPELYRADYKKVMANFQVSRNKKHLLE